MTSSVSMEDETLKIGLLMEAAQAQQALAETVLERLKDHMSTLDGVVRDEIRRAGLDRPRLLVLGLATLEPATRTDAADRLCRYADRDHRRLCRVLSVQP